MPKARACRVLGISCSVHYRRGVDAPRERDLPVIARLNEGIAKHGHWGFWECFRWMRLKGDR
jgi:hypothetical protein